MIVRNGPFSLNSRRDATTPPQSLPLSSTALAPPLSYCSRYCCRSRHRRCLRALPVHRRPRTAFVRACHAHSSPPTPPRQRVVQRDCATTTTADAGPTTIRKRPLLRLSPPPCHPTPINSPICFGCERGTGPAVRGDTRPCRRGRMPAEPTLPYGAVRYGTVNCIIVCQVYSTGRYGTVRYDTARYDIQHGTCDTF